MQIEAHFLCDSVSRVLFGEKRKHKIAGIAQIHKGEFKLVMVIMVENKVVNLFAPALQ